MSDDKNSKQQGQKEHQQNNSVPIKGRNIVIGNTDEKANDGKGNSGGSDISGTISTGPKANLDE